jgi:carotenoid cleavage dioxygenase
VYGSETAVAPRTGSQSEDDGYLVTIISDMNRDLSECLVFDAGNVGAGPVCRVRLPERVSSGTHSTWAPGSAIPHWGTLDDPAKALHL